MENRFILRPAAEKDFPAIQRLIRQVQINPTALDWRRFVVAVDGLGEVRGCGQLKPHGKEIIELASIAVVPSDRSKGVARLIIEHLIAKAPRSLYLTCRSGLQPFHEKWGFRVIGLDEMPPYYRRLSRFANLMLGMVERGESMLVMKLM
ncbi:MAG: GNAT family N-acetyltransferase [Chloroflexi bacterium]|nr:GNAT family N-acetyltransferase [Chloroflexota bacterium]